MSKVMAAVQKGKAITVTKGGKTIAKITGHNIKEDYSNIDEFPISKVDGKLGLFLSTMNPDEMVSITENGNIVADITKL